MDINRRSNMIVGVVQQAMNTTLPIVWDYEGTMTVGLGYGIQIGWEDFGWGSISPLPNDSLPIDVSGISWIPGSDILALYDGLPLPITNSGNIEINGVLHTYTSGTVTIPNPFPAVGETCTIKFTI